MDMTLKFWGVRGSYPTTAPANQQFGGNTPCVELRTANGEIVILDAGTGIRGLGCALASEFAGRDCRVNLFFSHFHWDHVLGLPSFRPLYQGNTTIAIHSASPPHELQRILGQVMGPPHFPVDWNATPCRKDFVQASCSSPVRYGDLRVQPFPLNHHGGACGYRVDFGGSSVVYASDTEFGDPEFDRILRRHAQGADVLIYDAQYTPEEYEMRRGWGHSTWEHAIQAALEADVKRLVLFHHDPDRADTALHSLLAEARRRFPRCCAAREEWTIEL